MICVYLDRYRFQKRAQNYNKTTTWQKTQNWGELSIKNATNGIKNALFCPKSHKNHIDLGNYKT